MDPQRKKAGCILVAFGILPLLLGVPTLLVQIFGNFPNKLANIIIALIMILIGGAFIYFGLRVRKSSGPAKTLKDLTAYDFPGVDPRKFSDWKAAQLEAQSVIAGAIKRGYLIIIPALFFGILIRGLVGSLIFILFLASWFAYMFLYVRPLGDKARELQKEAGIDRTRLTRALSGEVHISQNEA